MSEQSPPADNAPTWRPPDPTLAVDVSRKSGLPLQLTPGTVLGGRYRIVSLIGRGGMGRVYRADDLNLGQTVALKFLSHRGAVERLYGEVRIGRQISHPNVCRLYDIAEVDGEVFITMEFVDGEDLESLLQRVGRLPVEKALAVSRELCAGLEAAHERGVIHRDLKPANVMIDGRGRARVTDFGIALAEGSVSDGAGTPAYMAPEQLAGEAASFRSDIYALGLVLYEIVTGRRAFSASSNHDLMMQQREANYPRPSVVTREVPAAVERIIVRCLDPDPRERPESVAHIVSEMPGGDPLAAAIAAGDTPTPGMVAAAATSGNLRAVAVWPLFAFILAAIAASAFLSTFTTLYRATDSKSPEVLKQRSLDVLAQAGVTATPADWDLDVFRDDEMERIISVYRYARTPMRPRNAEARLTMDDPPLDQGMANVTMDASGKLLRLVVAPPKVDEVPPEGTPRWEPFVLAAGFDPRSLAAAAPAWTAPVDSDSKVAWQAPDGLRIEAAAFHGRPVWFQVISPVAYRQATRPSKPSALDRLSGVTLVFYRIVTPLAVFFLARRNMRRRMGDSVGALRTATFFFFVFLISLVAHAHHPMTIVDEGIIASWHVIKAAFWAAFIGVAYVAVEPLARRRWPEMLISWTRLLAGRFNDPMVGRDLLVGAATGMLIALLWHGTAILAEDRATGPTSALGPARHVLYSLSSTVGDAVVQALGLITVLVILRAIVRNTVVAGVLAALILGVMELGDAGGPLALRAAFAILAGGLGVALTFRFGLLAAIACDFYVLVMGRLPLTLDPDAWYFARSALVVALLVGLAAYALRLAVGPKRWLPRLALDDA